MFPANRISMPPIAQDFIPLIYQRNEEVLKRGRSILFQWFLFAGMCVYKTINIPRPDYLRFDTFFFFFFISPSDDEGLHTSVQHKKCSIRMKA